MTVKFFRRAEVASYSTLLGLVFLFDLLFTLPPFLTHTGFNPDLLYRFFQPVCHQMDSRSFHIFGYKLAVCSRCASIYYGLTLGIIMYPLFRPLEKIEVPSFMYLSIPLLFLAADFALNFVTPIHNTFASRAVTGGLLGVSTSFFLVPIWVALLKEFKTRKLLQHEK